MNLNEHVATGVLFLLTAVVVWLKTRRSADDFIRRQWRQPQWLLLRLLILFAIFHGLCANSGVHPVQGLLFISAIGLSALFAIMFDFSGIIMGMVVGISRLIYEWIFWLPSRCELILRIPTSDSSDRSRRTSGFEGLEGIAVTDLKPVGTIRIAGVVRAAQADFGFICKGERVLVESMGDFELRVRKMPDDDRR